MSKCKIFISHISEERELASSLKNFIEKKFLKVVEVFVSSDDESINLGSKWLDTIKDSLNDCKLEIILCSPYSVNRPWINFEAGSGWTRNIPTIPMCHSGMRIEELPMPIKALQAGYLNNENDIKKLFKMIARTAGMDVPESSTGEFACIVKEFEEKNQKSILNNDIKFIDSLLYHQIGTLKYAIYEGTSNNIEYQKNFNTLDFEEYKFTFSDVYKIFNKTSILSSLNEKIYDVLYKNIIGLSNNIKFILTYNGLRIPESLKSIFNKYIYAIGTLELWYEPIKKIDLYNEEIKNISIKMLKDGQALPVKKQSNLINIYVDLYENISFYKDWIIEYENIINKILDK